MKNSILIYVAAALFFGASVARSAEPSNVGHAVPAPWKATDLGLAGVAPTTPPAAPTTTKPAARATVPGSATHADGVFTLQGTMDLWGTADGCHFAYQPASGDVELIARVTAMENPGGVAHAKASLSIRASLEAGAPHVTLAVTATDGAQFLHRDEADGKTAKVAVDAETQKKLLPKAKFPIWLKLTRVGSEFTAYESADGTSWQITGKLQLKLPPQTVAGIACSSHKPDVVTKATFDHVSIRETALLR